jgi:DNA-binding transcriptional LysR family regulator
MKIDPRHLELLAAIVEHGGLTEGAAALGKSQPSASRSLALLEDRLGLALFVPGRRPLQPTELCQALVQEGRKVLEAGNTASKLVRLHKSGHVGSVRIAGSPFFMDGVVLPILAGFQTAFPDVHINQSYGYAREVIADLQNDTADLGIVPIRATEVPSDIAAHDILPGRNVIACRIGHPLARQSEVRVADIAQYSWIAPPPESPLYHDLRGVLDGIGVKEFKVSFSGGSLASVTNVLANSDAITVLPYSVVFNLRRQNLLTALSIRIGDPDRSLCILMRQETNKKSATGHLAQFIRSEFVALGEMIQRSEKPTRLETTKS